MQLALTILGYVISGLEALAPVLANLLSHVGADHPAAQHLSDAAASIANAKTSIANAVAAVSK